MFYPILLISNVNTPLLLHRVFHWFCSMKKKISLQSCIQIHYVRNATVTQVLGQAWHLSEVVIPDFSWLPDLAFLALGQIWLKTGSFVYFYLGRQREHNRRNNHIRRRVFSFFYIYTMFHTLLFFPTLSLSRILCNGESVWLNISLFFKLVIIRRESQFYKSIPMYVNTISLRADWDIVMAWTCRDK